jgi:hypothetical protein
MNLPTTPTNEHVGITGNVRTRVSNFINKAACKQYIMDYADQTRHHKFSRLEAAIYDELNGVMRKHMRSIVARNPSVGKTIR